MMILLILSLGLVIAHSKLLMKDKKDKSYNLMIIIFLKLSISVSFTEIYFLYCQINQNF